MTNKLIMRNVLHNLKLYKIYFIILVFIVWIFYIFHLLEFPTYDDYFENILYTPLGFIRQVSMFINIGFITLVIYTHNIYIRSRQKEFTTYKILGLSSNKLIKMLCLESLIIFILSLIIGLAFGVICSPLVLLTMSSIIDLNNLDYHFIFSISEVIQVIKYLLLIFLAVTIYNILFVKITKFEQLLVRKQLEIKNRYIFIGMLILIILTLFIVYNLFFKYNVQYLYQLLFIAITTFFIGTVCLLFSLKFITKFIKQSSKLKFKNLNLFTFTYLEQNSKYNFISFIILFFVFFITIFSLTSVAVARNTLLVDIKNQAPYDYTLINFPKSNSSYTGDDIWKGLPSNLTDPEIVKFHESFYTYTKPDFYYEDLFNNVETYTLKEEIAKTFVPFISLSEYNALLKARGYNQIALMNDEYFVIYDNNEFAKNAQNLVKSKPNIELGDRIYTAKRRSKQINLSNQNYNLALVVPDVVINNLSLRSQRLNINTDEPNYVKRLEAIEYREGISFTSDSTKHQNEVLYTKTNVIVTSLLIYIIVAAISISLFIIFVNQMFETRKLKKSYQLLFKLGADKQMLQRSLFLKTSFYFMLPIIFTIICISFVTNNTVYTIDVFNNKLILPAVLIMFTYLIYFILICVNNKRIINDIK